MFDGQLIIDTELRTNDPSIFAAGTITKYCRRFYAEIWQHVHFNSTEIGEKGQVLVTGSCTSDIGYFRIRLNRFDLIETVTCFTKQNIEVHHMIALYGKHQSLLNELKTRFEKSLIADFYAYFREPWAMAIFYDRFECLRVENRATLLSKTIKDNDRQTIQSRFAGSVYQQEIEENLLDFLQFAEEDLPVYCTPGKLRELYLDIEDSPLYTNL
ncbi:hypothetical protein K0M31_006362 [Melipona bicolor]|uniref:CFAP61 dimerisation domain-containing protein n=1 Tax=Melipona bicolor TaxID=60889 RepID=A0AA40FTE9_9HYME|nr:hypothetical protein K0M31_006362 [Melipona bicolor]